GWTARFRRDGDGPAGRPAGAPSSHLSRGQDPRRPVDARGEGSIMWKRWLLAVLVCGGCDALENLLDPPAEDGGEEPADGVSGGTFATPDGAFVVEVPAGAIPPELGAQPTVERLAAPADLLDHDDAAVSDGFVIDLHAQGGFDTTADVTVTLSFDAARVPEATR